MCANEKTRLIDRLFKRLNIRKQIMGSMIFICAVSLMTLGVIVFGISKKTIETNYKNAHEYNLQVSSRIIEIQLQGIIEYVRTLLINDPFMSCLKEEGGSRYFSGKNQQILNKELGDMSFQNQFLLGMLVVNEYGKLHYFSKNQNTRAELGHYYDTDNLLEEDWVRLAKAAEGKEIFYGYNVLTNSDADYCVSLVKNLIDPYSRESVGYLVVNIKKSLLDKAFEAREKGYETNRYLIMESAADKKTELIPDYTVYFNGNPEEKSDIVRHYEQGLHKGKYLFSTYRNRLTGWDIVNVIEISELSRDSGYVGWSILLVGIALTGISIVISQLISGQISRPLNTLAQTISEVGEGNLRVEADFEDNEVGRIGNQFKRMVNNNLELRERLLNTEIKEREAELLLLQSQINPHFLYNTLDSLYFMAVIDQADDIADMVLSLSNTFKLSLNKGGKLIQVRDEIEKMKAYMKIQNLRYHDRFEFRLQVDEEILEEKILTFILQPIIENSMYHGLEPKIGKGCISVTGHREKQLLHFMISDNGVGIDDMSKLEKGYGVHNVRERIRLFYGEGYTVEFSSQVGVGTTADICVPVITGEDAVCTD